MGFLKQHLAVLWERASFAMLQCDSRVNSTDQLNILGGAPEYNDLWVINFLVISGLNSYRHSFYLLLCHVIVPLA